MAAATHPLRANDPTEVGGIALEARLGAGGMGTVYAGRTRDRRGVAVKVVRDELASDAAFRTRFRREIEAVRRVQGRYTAGLVAAGPDDDPPWMAVELVDGPNLQQRVREDGPLPAAQVHGLAVALADALTAIHAAGVVHRDLKPSNVLLADDAPRVVDFGVASAADTTQLTLTGVVVGSPAFMAPEQARGEPAGTAADMYSYAATLVFAARGSAPHAGETPHVVIYRLLHERPDLSGLDDLAPELRSLVVRCLDADASRRPSAADALRALTGTSDAASGTVVAAVESTWHLDAAPTVLAPSPPPASRPRGRVGVAAAAAVALAVVVAVLLVAERDGGDGTAAVDDALGAASSTTTTSTTTPSSLTTVTTTTTPSSVTTVATTTTSTTTPSSSTAVPPLGVSPAGFRPEGHADFRFGTQFVRYDGPAAPAFDLLGEPAEISSDEYDGDDVYGWILDGGTRFEIEVVDGEETAGFSVFVPLGGRPFALASGVVLGASTVDDVLSAWGPATGDTDGLRYDGCAGEFPIFALFGDATGGDMPLSRPGEVVRRFSVNYYDSGPVPECGG